MSDILYPWLSWRQLLIHFTSSTLPCRGLFWHHLRILKFSVVRKTEKTVRQWLLERFQPWRKCIFVLDCASERWEVSLSLGVYSLLAKGVNLIPVVLQGLISEMQFWNKTLWNFGVGVGKEWVGELCFIISLELAEEIGGWLWMRDIFRGMWR